MASVIKLVNTPECPCPWTHNAACSEFLKGFIDHGFEVGEALTLEECRGANILLLSNHRICWMWLNDLNAANPDAIYILWCYHEHVDRIPFRRWILTGEHYFQPPTLSTHKPIHALNKKLPNFVPLLLRVNESPVNIGQDQEGSRKYLGCFMGSPYKREWIQGIPGVFYHSIYDGFLSSAERASIHRESVFGFGFHSDDNVKNNHVTQRVFEAMAYGCVVLSDNPAATAMTGGIVENVRSPDELRTKIQYFLQNPEIIAAKRTAGYDWCRQWGTNRYAAQCFLDKIKVLWG